MRKPHQSRALNFFISFSSLDSGKLYVLTNVYPLYIQTYWEALPCFVCVIWPSQLSCLSSSVGKHLSRTRRILVSIPTWGSSSFSLQMTAWVISWVTFWYLGVRSLSVSCSLFNRFPSSSEEAKERTTWKNSCTFEHCKYKMPHWNSLNSTLVGRERVNVLCLCFIGVKGGG